jgi:Propeptide_C25.
MKKTVIFIIVMGTSMFLNAQISDSYILTPNDLTIQTNGEYDILEATGHSYTDEIGNPQLPIKIVSFVLPYESTVTGISVNATQQQLNGSYYIFPAQPPQALNGENPPPFAQPNAAVYNVNTPYPNKTVEIISDGYTHGYHVVTIAIYPVVYHPANREIYLRNISFTINYTNVFDNNLNISFEKQSYTSAELGKQFVQNRVKNTDAVENCRNHR